MVKQYFLSQIWNLNHFICMSVWFKSMPHLYHSLCLCSHLLQKAAFWYSEDVSLAWGRQLTVTTRLPILLYLMELCSRYTQHWTGSTLKPLSGPLHMHHCQIVTLSLHVANNIKKTWEMFIVWSFHTCIIVSHTVSCVEVLPWLLCKELCYVNHQLPHPLCIPHTTSFSSILLKLIIQF